MSSARGISVWTQRGMLGMAEELAITTRVNMEWSEAKARLPMDVVEVVLWAIRDTDSSSRVGGTKLPPYSKPRNFPASESL